MSKRLFQIPVVVTGLALVALLLPFNLPAQNTSVAAPVPTPSLRDQVEQLIAGQIPLTADATGLWEPEKLVDEILPDRYVLRPEVQWTAIGAGSTYADYRGGFIYKLPDQKKFYLQWDRLDDPTPHFYGPFPGSPDRLSAAQKVSPYALVSPLRATTQPPIEFPEWDELVDMRGHPSDKIDPQNPSLVVTQTGTFYASNKLPQLYGMALSTDELWRRISTNLQNAATRLWPDAEVTIGSNKHTLTISYHTQPWVEFSAVSMLADSSIRFRTETRPQKDGFILSVYFTPDRSGIHTPDLSRPWRDFQAYRKLISPPTILSVALEYGLAVNAAKLQQLLNNSQWLKAPPAAVR